MSNLHLDYIDYKKVFKDQDKRLSLINKFAFIPTKLYLQMVYWIKTGKHLNLKKPQGFSQKLNWLKVNNIHPEYTQFVDKYAMKKYISVKFGSQYVIPCLGVWDSFDSIDFDVLPGKFILKCTHDSGSYRIIDKRDNIDYDALRKHFRYALNINAYNIGREYPYKNVSPRIIAEEFYSNEQGGVIDDYRFFCFDGKVKVFYVASERGGDERETWFNRDLERVEIIDRTNTKTHDAFELPAELANMIEFAEKLAKDIKFVRVDLYECSGKYYFGEMTFFPYGGFLLLEPPEWEEKLGEWINIDK